MVAMNPISRSSNHHTNHSTQDVHMTTATPQTEQRTPESHSTETPRPAPRTTKKVIAFVAGLGIAGAALAAVRVSEAVVSRLEKEQSYQKVIAPFDGVVTQRNVELGSLVTAGSAAGVTPLFRIEQNELLKVYIDAPQSAAPSIAVGQAV